MGPRWQVGSTSWLAEAKSAEEREKDRLQDDVYAFEETNFKQRHLWAVDLTGTTTRVTEGDLYVTRYAISPDGTRLVMSRAPSPLLEFSHLAELWVTDRAVGTRSQLTSGNRVSEGSLAISPDNTRVLFTAGANEAMEGLPQRQDVRPSARGWPGGLMTPADAAYDVSDAEWSQGGVDDLLRREHGRARRAVQRSTSRRSGPRR